MVKTSALQTVALDCICDLKDIDYRENNKAKPCDHLIDLALCDKKDQKNNSRDYFQTIQNFNMN